MVKTQHRLIVFFQFIFSFSCFAQTWQWQNPLPQGNTLQGVHLFNSQNVITVGHAATVMRTQDSGQTWDIKYFVDSTKTRIYSVDFSDGDNGIAVGLRGLILSTNDGGITWTNRESGTDETLNRIQMLNDTLAFAVGDEGTMLRSQDSGMTWQSLNSNTNYWLTGLSFINTNTGMVSGEVGTILKTTDGGETWTRLMPDLPAPVPIWSVFMLNENIAFTAGHSHLILRTEDGGETWTIQTEPAAPQLFSIAFFNDSIGVAAGMQEILRTTNAGLDWEDVGLETSDILYDIGVSGQTGFVVGSGGRMYKTHDSGESWIDLVSPTTREVYDIHFSDEMKGIAVGTKNILSTSDGGNQWQAEPNDYFLRGFFLLNSNIGMACGDFGKILLTTDGGSTWVEKNSERQTTYRGIFMFDEILAIAVGSDSKITKTEDGGDTWELKYNNGAILEAVSFADRSTGLAVDGGEVLQTVDGGETWRAISFEYINIPDFRDVFFVNSQEGYLLDRRGVLYKTLDTGKTWQANIIDVPNALRSVYFYDSNSGLIVGSGGLVLVTHDGGETWNRVYCGTTNWLFGAFMTDSQTGYACGENGTIIKIKLDNAVEVRNEPLPQMPESFRLQQNYPNPFNPITTIFYSLPKTSRINIKIYDLLGREVKTLYSGQKQAGKHKVVFNAENLASGIYIYRLQSKEFTKSRKLLLIK